MKDISEELDIKYTGVAIGTYQNKVTPPFENFTGKIEIPIYYLGENY